MRSTSMKTRWLTLAGTLVLAGCGPAPTAIPTNVPPSASATVPSAPAPTPSPTVEPRCPEPTEGTQLLTHEEDGYCFLYPNGLLRVDPSPHTVCLVPEGDTQGCDNLVAGVEVTDAEGRTAAQIADERRGGEGGFEPGRCTAPIAGIQAWFPHIAIRVYATCCSRGSFVHTKFAHPTPTTSRVGDLVHLFNTVTASFTLPPSSHPARPRVQSHRLCPGRQPLGMVRSHRWSRPHDRRRTGWN
jgi:hypothetical protein